MMTEPRRRVLAMQAVRGELRRLGKIPHHVSGKNAYVVLDELARRGIYAALWQRTAKEYSLSLWIREWDRWANAEIKAERERATRAPLS